MSTKRADILSGAENLFAERGFGAPSLRDVLAAATLPATRYDDAMHGMMEVLLQESSFDAPLVQPLQERDEALILENPIHAVHDEIEAYFTDFVATGEAHVDQAR